MTHAFTRIHGVAALACAFVAACGVSDGRRAPEATETTAAALTQPLPSLSPTPHQAGMIRPVVSVGRDWVLETNTGQVLAYRRNVDANGTINVGGAADYQGNLWDIFGDQTQIYNDRLTEIDTEYSGQLASGEIQQLVPPCTPSSTQFCASAWYDGDTVYDEYSGHFFVMTKVRRPVWGCRNIGLKVPSGYDSGWNDGHRTNGVLDHPCIGASNPYVQAISERPIMVAITKCNIEGQDCENPNNGWQTYTLAVDDFDWAQINVSRGLVMVNYRVASDTTSYPGDNGAGKIWGYSAQALINGLSGTHWMPPGGAFFDSESFPTIGIGTSGTPVSTAEASNANIIMFASMHGATSADYPTLVTMHDGNDVWVYNVVPSSADYQAAAKSSPLSPELWDLSPWITTLQISSAGVVSVPTSMSQQWNAHPVWSSNTNSATAHGWPGTLYWSFVNTVPGGVSAFEWPMTSTLAPPNGLNLQLSADPSQGYREWDVGLGDTSHGYDFPILEHNMMSGENLLVFHQTATTAPPFAVTPRYVVDDVAAPPQAIQLPSAVNNLLPSAGGSVDIVSNVSDPIRPQVFFTAVTSVSSTAPAPAAGGFLPWMAAVPMPQGSVNVPRVPGYGYDTGTTIAPPVPGENTEFSNTITIPFTNQGTPTLQTPVPPPSCTVGGDLRTGAATGALGYANLKVTAQAVTVTFGAFAGTPAGTYMEGISCSNGISLAIPVTVLPPLPPLFTLGDSSIQIVANHCAWEPVIFGTQCYTPAPSVWVDQPLPSGIASVTNDTGYAGPQGVEICAGSAPGKYVVTMAEELCHYATTQSVTVNVTQCYPATCQPGNCGAISDGCGGTLQCGATCGSSQVCNAGTCCTPLTAAQACGNVGAQCGTLSNGCGGTVNCGSCPRLLTCGGGGEPYVCGRTPVGTCTGTTCM